MKFPLIDLLYQAFNAEKGVIVETNDPEKLRQKLYAERKKDPDLACLTISLSRVSPANRLIIWKKPNE